LALALGASTLLDSKVHVSGTAMFPTQTFYVPLPEKDLYEKTFKVIKSDQVSGNVNSIVAIAVSTDNTIGKTRDVSATASRPIVIIIPVLLF
jgi:hypothetical protein